MTFLEQIESILNERHDLSAWNKGVTVYALELCEERRENENYTGQHYTTLAEIMADIKNGADNWRMYSYGGCSLIYDGDICERLCCPSFQRKKDFGRLYPNSRETWLDLQARALYQAERRIIHAARLVMRREAA